jgi:hypothetical protein
MTGEEVPPAARPDVGLPPKTGEQKFIEEQRQRGETSDEATQRIEFEKTMAKMAAAEEGEDTGMFPWSRNRRKVALQRDTSKVLEEIEAAHQKKPVEQELTRPSEAMARLQDIETIKEQRRERPISTKEAAEILGPPIDLTAKIKPSEFKPRPELVKQKIKSYAPESPKERFKRQIKTGFKPVTLLEKVGEDLLAEREKGTTTWTYEPTHLDEKTGKVVPGKAIKTWYVDVKNSIPGMSGHLKKNYEETYDLDAKGRVGRRLTHRMKSTETSPFTAQELENFHKSWVASLNGASIGAELFGAKGRAPKTPGEQFGVIALEEKGGGTGRFGGLRLFGGYTSGQRQYIPAGVITRAERGDSSGSGVKKGKRGMAVKMIKADVNPPTPENIRRSTIQPIPAYAAQGATDLGSMPERFGVTPRGYVPEYSNIGARYQKQVRRYIQRPKIVGFIPPRHSYRLVGGQKVPNTLGADAYTASKKMRMYTGLSPFKAKPQSFGPGYELRQGSIYNLAGISHSNGPTHDIVNQVFDPVYAIHRLRGTSRAAYGGYQAWNLLTGGRPPVRTSSWKLFMGGRSKW